MTILSIETSCDETGAAVVKTNPSTHELIVERNIISTSLGLHAKTGGIIPEKAAREQLKFIIPVIKEAISGLDPKNDIDLIAVTFGPGLIGSLLVGVETARTLSYVWNKPLIPVNHLYGHIYANFIGNNKIDLPAIALVVSGGHTDLVHLKSHKDIEVIGSTRDDAAGEAFDKIGRLLGLEYPAGPMISKLAENGNPDAYAFPRPMIGSGDFDFSFSGLKTAVLNEVKKHGELNEKTIADICASSQKAIVEVIAKKALKAAKEYGVNSILLGGGVAANTKLRDKLKEEIEKQKINSSLSFPTPELCTDNAAMIAAAAYYKNDPVPWQKIKADPSAYY